MPTERELVQRAIAGDAQAFGELYEENLKQIYRYVYYKVGSAAEAEDLTEQTFLKAWEAIGRFKEQGIPFSAWLFRMAHNLVIDYHRTHHESAPLDDLIGTDDGRAGPDDVVAVKLDVETLRRAIRLLTAEQQQVIILRLIHGLSHAEVAAIMGKNEGAVRGLQHRALATLHEILAASGIDEEL